MQLMKRSRCLGTRLVLPPWLESMRSDLERILPPVNLPKKTIEGTNNHVNDYDGSFISGMDKKIELNNKNQLGFIHKFIPPESRKNNNSLTLLLLHGTGGEENDLIPIARMLEITNASILSPRGKVLENGMPRFFRRLAEGVFDIEDLKFSTNELADFVQKASRSIRF